MQGVLAYLALCLFNYGVLYFGQYRYRIRMEPFMVLVAAPFACGDLESARNAERPGGAAVRGTARQPASIRPTGAREHGLRGRHAAADRQELIRVMPAKRAAHTTLSTQRPSTSPSSAAASTGLAVAWRARARGLSVCVLDRGELGARRVARRRRACSRRSPRPTWASARCSRSGCDARARAGRRSRPSCARRPASTSATARCGTLVVARDRDEAEALDRELALRARLGLAAERLLPRGRAPPEPALAPTVRLALDVPDDHAVDPRLLTAALARGRRARRRRSCAPARRWRACCTTGARVHGVELAGGERLAAGRVVVAAGAWSGAARAARDARVPVRPVKGQTLRLRDPAGPGLLERVVRFEGGYLVPRGDGRYVLGATVEERGFDTSMTAGAVTSCCATRPSSCPACSSSRSRSSLAGLRPGTPDNAPVLGASPRSTGWSGRPATTATGSCWRRSPPSSSPPSSAGEAGPAHAFGPGRFAAPRRWRA